MVNRLLLIAFILCVCIQSSLAQSNKKLWYDEPANYFEEALVLGNGKTGATVFGGVQSDKIYLNDATLWSGEPVNANMNPEAYKEIPKIREALANEDYRLADQLNKKIQGKFSQSFAPLGTIYLHFDHQGEINNYYRELDLSTATANIKYNVDDVDYTREYFVSHPDQVMLIKLTASKKQAISFEVSFESLLKYRPSSEKQLLQINGYAPYHAEPDYRWNVKDPVRFDKDRGTRFTTLVKVNNTDGTIAYTDSTIKVSNASEAILIVSIATSFNGFDKDPAKEGLDQQKIAIDQLKDAESKSFKAIKQSHISDYQNLFNRVEFELSDSNVPNIPTDERLKKYSNGATDRNLEILYFQYGRYLLISSSRTPGVPANLQGIWNQHIRPPWSSNYTMNINVEENYWLAETANLSELHAPFLSFIKNLSVTGKVTAKTFYGIDKGWAAAHNSDIWAMSNPVGDFGQGEPVWACWNMSGTWTVTHLWDHYLFTGDHGFLKNEAYPLMKGAAEFCLGWLIFDKNGYLISSPSTSPENNFLTPDGYRGATLYGGTADLAMIRECFQQTIEAATILNIDKPFCDSLTIALNKLYPYQISKKGTLQEWYHDWEDVDPQHRHQTHLYGLYPGHQIQADKTLDLAAACRKTLEVKGDESTGWSKGWRINLWARLWDGNRAYKLFRELLSYVPPDGANNIDYNKGGGTYPNLLDAHPPFQIDGNFGGAAGVTEMLLQSTVERIVLLPALPESWKSGSIKGLCSRGGFEVAITWDNGRLSNVNIESKAGNNCTLQYEDKKVEFETIKGKKYSLDANLTMLN